MSGSEPTHRGSPSREEAAAQRPSHAATCPTNFDGIPGPTHNYAGLARGNLAAERNARQVANPRQAALQGLAKMRALAARGFAQAVLPPQARPNFRMLRRLGFSGTDADVLAHAWREAPVILACAYSASPMWTANAATVSPSADSADGRVHFTTANLQNRIHRSIEPLTTARILRAIFRDSELFAHHEPLPATAALGDEGAANHTRLTADHAHRGVQLFVFGESAANPWNPRPKVFPARQTLEACQALQRLHRLPDEQVIIAQQN